jgi:four helix bundle protein
MTDTGFQMPDKDLEAEPTMNSINYSDLPDAGDDAALALNDSGKPMGYRDLQIWQIARDMTGVVHRMTLEKLPRFELHEEGSQIRRSAKSVRSNIVEGFGRRRYKQDFIKHLVYAEASCDETRDHLDTLFETGSLTDEALYETLCQQLGELARKIYRFIAAVEQNHQSPK